MLKILEKIDLPSKKVVWCFMADTHHLEGDLNGGYYVAPTVIED